MGLSGGCDAANKLVREAIRHALMRMGQTIEQDFSELIGLLNTSSPVPNTPVPEMVSHHSSFHSWATQMMSHVSTRGLRRHTQNLAGSIGKSSKIEGQSSIAENSVVMSQAPPTSATSSSRSAAA